MTLPPALSQDTATEVGAQWLAAQHGGYVTFHGDDFQASRTEIIRDSHGWPSHVAITLADHSRGDSVSLWLAVVAMPIGGRG